MLLCEVTLLDGRQAQKGPRALLGIELTAFREITALARRTDQQFCLDCCCFTTLFHE